MLIKHSESQRGNHAFMKEKKKITIGDILILQGAVVIYTLSSVTAKYAAGQEMLSAGFFAFYGLEVVILGLYAIAWQQIIKRFDPSVAYANRAMGGCAVSQQPYREKYSGNSSGDGRNSPD